MGGMLIMWAGNAREYLNALIRKSTISRTSATSAAVAEIITLLDGEQLDGLLSAMRRDCNQQESLEKQITELKKIATRLNSYRDNVAAVCSELEEQKSSLYAEVKALTEKAKSLKITADLAEMLPDERSRLNAYKQALEIGVKTAKEATTRAKIDDDVTAQIIRSAANVAAGFMPNGKHETQQEEK